MNRNDKKSKRNYISTYIDTSKSRLKDDEVDTLCDFIDEYEEKYRGKSQVYKSSYDGWNSEGKYTREEEITYTFNDDISIHEEYSYHDDDGQFGHQSRDIKDVRGILN